MHDSTRTTVLLADVPAAELSQEFYADLPSLFSLLLLSLEKVANYAIEETEVIIHFFVAI